MIFPFSRPHIVRSALSAALLATLLATPTAPFAQESIHVTDSGGLRKALKRARGGETIILGSGSYGAVSLRGLRFSPAVTLRSETPHGARLDQLSVERSQGLSLEGLHISHPGNGGFNTPVVAIVDGSSDIRLTNSEINGLEDNVYSGHYGVFVDQSQGITIAGNLIHDVKNGAVLAGVTDLTVSGNKVEDIGEDSFKFIAVRNALIENNTGARYVYPAEGAHLDFMQFQGADSRDVVIRGNVFLPGNAAAAHAQGIFMDDATYTNILIERNTIVTGMLRGISISKGSGLVIRYNLVLDVAGAGSKATFVIADGAEIYGNIMGAYPSHDSIGEGAGNLLLQQDNPNAPWHYNAFFTHADAGIGITLQDLTRLPGSKAERYGPTATVK